ncbi:MAG: hypothetical protein ACTSP6_10660 [Promethearchaeota archaeon]
MYSNMENVTTEYEQKINKLSDQIRNRDAQIQQLKALLEDKDYHINLLYTENQELKTHIQNLQQPKTSNAVSTPQLHPPHGLSQKVQPTTPPKTISATMVRQCPNCAAYGFAIREIDDKSRIISYVPRRIYAKKKHCTKCGFEF